MKRGETERKIENDGDFFSRSSLIWTDGLYSNCRLLLRGGKLNIPYNLRN